MSCRTKLKKLICFFDTYATSFHVLFRNKSSFQTFFGSLISAIIILLGIAVLIFLYIFLENRDEQRIVTFNKRYIDPPEFYMSSDYNNVTYSTSDSKYGFFFYAIYFLNTINNQEMDIEEVNKNIEWFFQDTIYREPANSKIYETVQCNLLYPNISQSFNNPRLSNSYCIKNIILTVRGEFISDIYRYVLLRIIKKSTMSPDFIKNTKILIYRSDYTINTDITKDSPITYMIKPIEIPLNENISFEANIYVGYNKFFSNDNIYAPWAKKKIQNCFKIEKITPSYTEAKRDRLASIYLRSALRSEFFRRDFKSFFDLLCQLGGLWRVLVFIGKIIVIPINLRLMNVAISNKMFNMVHPNNEEDVQMTYKEFIAKEEKYDRVPEIFKSLNPLLKQLSIEYYRYERNRGMNFTVKEALTKILCSCFKIKSIRHKDMIFKSSQKEIQKRLDTILVAKFAQNVRAMKRVLLSNEDNFLNYITSRNIAFSLLGIIRQEYNMQTALSNAKPLSIVYLKQNHLVTAFNTLRNQGDLTKTDLLIIHLFKLDPKLVMKFFITYTDRFNLIYPELFGNQLTQTKSTTNPK